MELQGHDSIFDIYVHLEDEDVWFHTITISQQLIGDLNFDGVVDELDLPLLDLAIIDPIAWMTMFPGMDLLWAGDLNHDLFVDDFDLELMTQAVTMEYIADAEDIGEEILCPEDIDGSGNVGTTDLLAVLAAWGDCIDGCVADIDGDGMVGTTDLLAVLAAWGDC